MLLTALALTGAALQTPELPAIPEILATSDVTLVLDASGSHLAARNLGPAPQLLLFCQPTRGARAHVLLLPGQRLVVPIPEGAEGFLLEALDGTTPDSPSSGSLAVDGLRADGVAPVWVRRVERALEVVRVEGTEAPELTPVRTGPGLVRRMAAHVPAPVPTVDRKRTRDRLEKRPLPPV